MLRVGRTVEVTTVNQGHGPSAHGNAKKAQRETWVGTIVGRSPIGDDWWLVKKANKTMRGATYTVPRHEIRTLD
jgi:hypothetical protein